MIHRKDSERKFNLLQAVKTVFCYSTCNVYMYLLQSFGLVSFFLSSYCLCFTLLCRSAVFLRFSVGWVNGRIKREEEVGEGCCREFVESDKVSNVTLGLNGWLD